MLVLPHSALVTVEEVRRAALGSFSDAVQAALQPGSGGDETSPDSDIYDACIEIIEDVTGQIEDVLHRQLMVRAQSFSFRQNTFFGGHQFDWTTENGYVNDDGNLLWLAWARQWPIVQAITVDDDADLAQYVTFPDEGRRFAFDSDQANYSTLPAGITAFAGYRRQGQSLEELQAVEGLAELEVLPPELPRVIRRVALRLVIHEMRQQLTGLVGVRSTSKRIEQMTVQSQREDVDFVSDQLALLAGLAWEGA